MNANLDLLEEKQDNSQVKPTAHQKRDGKIFQFKGSQENFQSAGLSPKESICCNPTHLVKNGKNHIQ